MAKYGFLSLLEETLEKGFDFDFSMDWDKRNHSVEVSFILEAVNGHQVETVDIDGQIVSEDIALEEFVLFYNPEKSRFDADDYLVAIPYDTKKGLSKEFVTYFVSVLNQVAEQGLDDLMDFLADEEAEEFAMVWPSEAFAEGLAALTESDFYPYPRY